MEILGIFNSLEKAADAVDSLLVVGISNEQITSLSSVPYPEGVLIGPHKKTRFHLATLAFGALGATAGFLLAAGTAWLYPLQTGDKPIISVFPVGIVTYELMMLMAIIGTLVGMCFEMGLPDIKSHAYADEISNGAIGILVVASSEQEQKQAREVLQTAGALRLCHEESR